MKMKLNDLIQRGRDFAMGTVAPALADPMAKFRLGFVLPIGEKVADEEIRLAPFYCKESDEVDVTMLKACVMSGFDAGGAPSFSKFRIERSDAEKFFASIGA